MIATAFLKIVGGVEKYLQAVIPELVARGHQLCLVHEDAPATAAQTIDLDDLCFKCSLAELGQAGLLKKCGDWKPDVLYCNGLVSPALEEALLSSFSTAVMYGHGYYGTCGSGTKCHSFPIVEPCTRQFGKMCLVLHLPRRCGGLSPISAWTHYQLQKQRHDLLHRYGAVMVASRHMVNEFENNGVSPDKLRLVPYPTTDILPQSQPPSVRPLAGKLLYLGRLTSHKGLDRLLQAIPQAQEALGYKVSLTVAGSGPEEKSLRAAAQRSNLQVEFVGWADREMRIKMLQEADLLAVPSLWPEPFGLVGLEAACFALPAVGFDVGGISDWLETGVTGEIAPGDPPKAEGLATAIVRALKDPAHHHRLREGAWRKAREFTIARHIAQLEAVFSGVESAAPVAAG